MTHDKKILVVLRNAIPANSTLVYTHVESTGLDGGIDISVDKIGIDKMVGVGLSRRVFEVVSPPRLYYLFPHGTLVFFYGFDTAGIQASVTMKHFDLRF